MGPMVESPATDMDIAELEPGKINICYTSDGTHPITAAGIAANSLWATVKLDVKDTAAEFTSAIGIEAGAKLTNVDAVTLIKKGDLAKSLKAGSVTVGTTQPPVKTLESIAVAADAKVEYNVGDEFVAPAVTGTYSDGSTEAVEATFTGYDMATAGKQTVTVAVGDVTTTYTITVAAAPVKTLESIAVAADAKVEYTVGDDFVAPVVTGTYSDGSTEEVEATFTGYDMATAGTQTVTVAVGDVTTTYTITVAAAPVTLVSIAVAADAKVEYVVGDEFVAPVVTGTYSDGSTAAVEATFTGYDMATPGTQTVTVAVGEVTTTYAITVAEPVKEIASIYVAEGYKSIYKTGDEFVAPTVMAKYTNAYYADEEVAATFDGYDMATEGKYEVTATYEDHTAKFNITVDDDAKVIVSIAVKDAVVDYELDDAFVAPTVVVTYDDETTAEITTGAVFAGYDMATAGTQTVTVTYEGVSTTYEINVVDPAAKTVTSIEVDLDKTKTSYYKGNVYADGDAVLKVTYDDGSVDYVKVTDAMITGFKTSSVGPKIVTVTYDSLTATYQINVSVSGTQGGGSYGGVGNSKNNLIIISEEDEGEPRVLRFAIGSTKYTLDNKAYYTDAAFYLKNDRTMVPIRFIAETLGFTVDWNEATQTVTMTDGKTTIVLTIGSTTMYINGKAKIMDVAPEISNDRTCVPVRFVAEGFGGVVGWEDATQMVTITLD